MKKILIAMLFLFFLLKCKTSSDSSLPCGSYGGGLPTHTYLFWIGQDYGCGQVTVQVKDNQGNIISASSGDKIKVWNSFEPTNCVSTDHAVFSVIFGKTYTYRATCASRSWTGTFTASCESYACVKIKIQ